MNNIVYVTEEGLQKLKDEFQERTDVRRHEIADRLDKAIRMGDLKENADYHAAKEDQAFNEGRVQQLQEAIRASQIITASDATGVIRIGSTVTIVEEGMDEEEIYKIVGAQEANPIDGLISNESPIGKALIGNQVDSVVEANTPGGTMTFKVIKIS